VTSIEKLNKLGDKEMELILPKLFIWIADINWPVAKPIISLMSERPYKILDNIKKHFSRDEEDGELKHNIIMHLIPKLHQMYKKI